MKKTIKLKESDIINIVKRIIKEDSDYGMNKGDKSKTHKGRDYEGDDKQMIGTTGQKMNGKETYLQ